MFFKKVINLSIVLFANVSMLGATFCPQPESLTDSVNQEKVFQVEQVASDNSKKGLSDKTKIIGLMALFTALGVSLSESCLGISEKPLYLAYFLDLVGGLDLVYSDYHKTDSYSEVLLKKIIEKIKSLNTAKCPHRDQTQQDYNQSLWVNQQEVSHFAQEGFVPQYYQDQNGSIAQSQFAYMQQSESRMEVPQPEVRQQAPAVAPQVDYQPSTGYSQQAQPRAQVAQPELRQPAQPVHANQVYYHQAPGYAQRPEPRMQDVRQQAASAVAPRVDYQPSAGYVQPSQPRAQVVQQELRQPAQPVHANQVYSQQAPGYAQRPEPRMQVVQQDVRQQAAPAVAPRVDHQPRAGYVQQAQPRAQVAQPELRQPAQPVHASQFYYQQAPGYAQQPEPKMEVAQPEVRQQVPAAAPQNRVSYQPNNSYMQQPEQTAQAVVVFAEEAFVAPENNEWQQSCEAEPEEEFISSQPSAELAESIKDEEDEDLF